MNQTNQWVSLATEKVLIPNLPGWRGFLPPLFLVPVRHSRLEHEPCLRLRGQLPAPSRHKRKAQWPVLLRVGRRLWESLLVHREMGERAGDEGGVGSTMIRLRGLKKQSAPEESMWTSRPLPGGGLGRMLGVPTFQAGA